MMTVTSNAQRGAALLTVLMIIAAMSVAALAITQAVTNATQRARALDAQAQLGFYAVSAEEVARARLTSLLAPLESRLSVDMPGFNEAQTIPVDGGVFTVSIRDASNCFDVNRLSQEAENGALIADPDQQAAYQSILQALMEDGYATDAVALVSSLSDWMDENTVPGNGGAEDSYYLSEVPSYRTSQQPLATLDELRAIRGYTPEVLATIRPLLCALPAMADSGPLTMNINTLTEDQAALLRLAFSDALTVQQARDLIATRPQGGWQSLDVLMEDPIVTRIDPEAIDRDRLGLVTSLVEVSANLSYRGHDMTMRFLFEAMPGRPIRTLRRERIG